MELAENLDARRDQRLIEGVISHLALFAGVAPAATARLALRCSTQHALRGVALAEREALLPGVFAVAYGTVKLSLRGADGEERVLRLVCGGQTFGEANALLGRALQYEARALAESKLVMMPTPALAELAEREPRFARNLMLVLAQRSLELLAEFESATLRRGAQRLASYLDSLAAPQAAAGGRLVVELPVSKTMLAAQLGVKKETLSRLLRQLSSRGLIEVSRREVAILDRGALMAAATA
jgi:CRP/FNR family transcriptional regulator, dissimilatory nitrate respiration regulator